MRLLDRYLLRELLVPFGVFLCGFLILWIFGDLFNELQELQDHQLGAAEITYYYLLSVPDTAVLVSPIALLLALLYTLTNHARHHELTAIRAAGVGLWRMCLPYLGVGFVASLVVFALNELIVPTANEAADRVLGGSQWKTNIFLVNSRDERHWQIGAYHLDTHEMVEPKVVWRQQGNSQLEILANTASYSGGVWTFRGVTLLRSVVGSDAVPVREVKETLRMPEFTETPDEINSLIRITGQSRGRSLDRPEVPIRYVLNYLNLYPDLPADDKSWLLTQLHGRLATPWTCLVVVLIAIPFGVPSGRRNVFVGVASSILLCFIYIILMRLGLVLGTAGKVPSWLGAWLPNLMFSISGILLASRVR